MIPVLYLLFLLGSSQDDPSRSADLTYTAYDKEYYQQQPINPTPTAGIEEKQEKEETEIENTLDEFDDLTIEELRSLLDNFQNLTKSEQMDLIQYMRKLEKTNPEKVKLLKSGKSQQDKTE